jgi:t-SNARE complex subunit (syntaxin)
MNIDEFKTSIVKLFVESKKEEIEKLEKRLKEVKKLYRIKKSKIGEQQENHLKNNGTPKSEMTISPRIPPK